MMTTAEVLNKFKEICKGADNCQICPIGCAAMICDTPPEYWPNKDIEKIANAIDNYEEKEMFDICKSCANEDKEPCKKCVYYTRPYADNTAIRFDMYEKKKEEEKDV